MKNLLNACLALALGAATAATQPAQFRVPLYLQWGTKKDTVYVGVNGGNGSTIQQSSYGLDQVTTNQYGPLGLYGEAGSPPPDADGNRVRFIDLPGRTQLAAAGGLFRYDYRGYSSSAQADTFVIEVTGSVVEANDLVVSWPANLTNNGSAWTINSRTPVAIGGVIKDMLVAPWSHTFSVTGNPQRFAIVKVGATALSVEQIETGLPSAFGLEQNYPNPFNPSTEIRFTVPVNGRVSLRVYNLLGQEMATLVQGDLAAGSYATRFDGKGFASGVYLLRLEAEGSSAVRKMVLAK